MDFIVAASALAATSISYLRLDMNHLYRLVWNKRANMLVPVSEFARANGKGPRSARRARCLAARIRQPLCLMTAAVLSTLPLMVHAQSAAPFLDFSTLDNWTQKGGVQTLSTTDKFDLNGSSYSLTPAAGNSMVKITPGTSTVVGAGAADTALGLSSGTISALLGNSVTNFGIVSKTFTFNPGTYSFAWAYAAGDYQPFNDGVLFSMAGAGTQSVVSLARNGRDATDTSGPQPNTMVLGSYGSTAWNTTTFTVTNAGDYLVSYADYNWNDTGLDPVFYVTGTPGTFTGKAIVPVGGGIPAPITITGTSPANSSGLKDGTVTPAFDGGTHSSSTRAGISRRRSRSAATAARSTRTAPMQALPG
jgi:hypothetical protein